MESMEHNGDNGLEEFLYDQEGSRVVVRFLSPDSFTWASKEENRRHIEKIIQLAENPEVVGLIVDMSSTNFIDSNHISFLLFAKRIMTAHEKDTKVRNMKEGFRTVFRITQLDTIIEEE